MVTLRGPDWRVDNVQAVLFDKDGTLIDLHRYWGGITQRRALALAIHLGWPHERTSALERVMGFDRVSQRLLPQGPVGLLPRDEVIRSALHYVAAQGASLSYDEASVVFAAVHSALPIESADLVSVIPAALPLLTALREAGVLMAVVTSDSFDATVATLAQWDLARYFDVVLGRDSCNAPKHTGVPARIALERLGVAPANAICVGDAPMDAQMAQASACAACIGVATGQLDTAALRSYSSYVVDSLAQVTVHSRKDVLCP